MNLEVPVSASRNRFKNTPTTPLDTGYMNGTPRSAAGSTAHGQSSSLERLQAEARSPRSRSAADYPQDEREDTVEMSLLGNGGRADHDSHIVEEQEEEDKDRSKKPMSKKDKKAMTLLIILYLIQGVPLGLALGSVPFLLKEHLTYKQLAFISLSSYPYSLKLLWSPIVDALFLPKVGRRKSWIIPMQAIIGTMMLWISLNTSTMMEKPEGHLTELTITWTSLVFFAATQDIAVDGWALTLLSEESKAYASTAQTIGLNTGYFASYTVFLALNSETFSYDPTPHDDPDLKLSSVYKSMWKMIKLTHIQKIFLVHFVAKIAYQAHENVTSLKLVDKGLGKEDLAVAVLIDFPIQIIAGWYAGTWSRGEKPLRPWLNAYWARVFFAIVGMVMVYTFPGKPLSYGWFAIFILVTVTSSFAGTIQFVGVSAFHTRISDPSIGGTYMTMLNTFANMGGTWPGFFVLRGVDMFTVAHCEVKDKLTQSMLKVHECVSEVGKHECTTLKGQCVVERDGYYVVSCICIVVGVTIWLAFVRPTAMKLQVLPFSKWRVNQPR
ncbi:hypothetical protein M408DRAFT_325408 [Serendipita vermifera MAFF 305830]|uniref:Major facilitator superfamily (MFS) profile domain-containing protein n=1 Tax=Serendipita vermifera MAFF 305830 TaxID=933852 RepID=A0A0C3BNZ0_SERVB|nr:hypothetical protein M408DRAFT_325408 [Serendipita vermifera MAFF 305830]